MEQNYRMETVIKKEHVPAVIRYQVMSDEDLFVSPHWHEDVEINLLLLENGYFLIDGKETELQRGDINIINSGEIHAGFAADGVSHQEMITIQWDYEFFQRYCKNFSKCRFILEKDLEAKREIRDMVIQAALMLEEENPYAELKIVSILYQIGFLLLDCCLVEESDSVYYEKTKKISQIRETIQFIEEHYRENITLEMISDKMGITPTHFSKKFRQATGIRFYDFLVRCRVKNARNDLLNSKNSITEIAYDNGFPNVKSFIDSFKKYYHSTPKQYSKNYKE